MSLSIKHRSWRPALVGLLAAALTVVGCGGGRATPARATAAVPTTPTAVQVMVPDPDNLQWLSFWTAVGAGYFTEEGLDVRIITPSHPAQAPQQFLQGGAQVAVLAPPMYIGLMTQEKPILLFANLLRNDPIDLIVRRDVADARQLSPTAPLAERLKAIRGIKVGVAHGPPPRLRTLFASVGMDADKDIEMVIVNERQDEALAQKRVDALYAHTPYLERALVQQSAMLLVDQSRGDIPGLAASQVHALVTTRAYAAERPTVVAGMARAIYRAQQLAHADLKATADALLRSGVPGLERGLLEALLPIYQGNVPKTPEVSVKGIEEANRQFTYVDLSKVSVGKYLAPQFAEQAVQGSK